MDKDIIIKTLFDSIKETKENYSFFNSKTKELGLKILEINISTKFSEMLNRNSYKISKTKSSAEVKINIDWSKREEIGKEKNELIDYFRNKSSSKGNYILDCLSIINDNNLNIFEFKINSKIKEKEIIDISRTLDLMVINEINNSFFIMLDKKVLEDKNYFLDIKNVNYEELFFEKNSLNTNMLNTVKIVEKKLEKSKKIDKEILILKLSVNKNAEDIPNESDYFYINNVYDFELLTSVTNLLANEIRNDSIKNFSRISKINESKNELGFIYKNEHKLILIKECIYNSSKNFNDSLGKNVIHSISKKHSKEITSWFIKLIESIKERNVNKFLSLFNLDKNFQNDISKKDLEIYFDKIFEKNDSYPTYFLLNKLADQKTNSDNKKKMNVDKLGTNFDNFFKKNNSFQNFGNNEDTNHFLIKKINTKRAFFITCLIGQYCSLDMSNEYYKFIKEDSFKKIKMDILKNAFKTDENQNVNAWHVINHMIELFFIFITHILLFDSSEKLSNERYRNVMWYVKKISKLLEIEITEKNDENYLFHFYDSMEKIINTNESKKKIKDKETNEKLRKKISKIIESSYENEREYLIEEITDSLINEILRRINS